MLLSITGVIKVYKSTGEVKEKKEIVLRLINEEEIPVTFWEHHMKKLVPDQLIGQETKPVFAHKTPVLVIGDDNAGSGDANEPQRISIDRLLYLTAPNVESAQSQPMEQSAYSRHETHISGSHIVRLYEASTSNLISCSTIDPSTQSGSQPMDPLVEVPHVPFRTSAPHKRTIFSSDYFGGPDVVCRLCHAHMWSKERVQPAITVQFPVFSLCCKQGLTCLSEGGGFHFPPCHMLNLSGFRILLECPLDLSSLGIFAPVPVAPEPHGSLDADLVFSKKQKVEKPLDAKYLVHAVPWYKTVRNLHLWDVSFIDVVLISSPMGMLGLPLLTRTKDFSAKVYVTEATARIGQLLMEDLVSMHMEFRQFYGPEDSSFPQWMRWEELEGLPSELKKIALGKDCEELGAWMPLYSAGDVKDCMMKVQTLKYAEEACYNGTLIIKAFSSGLDIGTCNWRINGPRRNVAYISSSIFVSTHAMDFDFLGPQGSDLIIYSDFSSLDATENMENDAYFNPITCTSSNTSIDVNNMEETAAYLLKDDESTKEMEKLAFICSCALESVRGGGSVLIPVDRLGIVLCLLEQLSDLMESSSLKVPIYIISSVAEELLAFTNIIPEWLCKQRQDNLFSGEPLFDHTKLIKERKIHVFPAIHSPELLTNWQEPCVVFCPHWSLRLGPVVHLLRHWCSDPNSLLVIESGVDADIALLPFKPVEMKVLQCSFLCGIRLHKVKPLLRTLQPKLVLIPKDLGGKIQISEENTIFLYSENDETLCIPSPKESTSIEIATDLASGFQWKMLEEENITRLEGELFMDHGKHRLLSRSQPADSNQQRPLLHWGSPDLKRLLTELSKMGINGTIKQVMDDAESVSAAGIVDIHDPKKALINVQETGTVIISADENLASDIVKAIENVLDGI
ncbi:hypothetical protein CCACVL1_16109 [Corchorus capsularis]|uniref:Beta-Casp domain-containing protein n=1 Tax=Corchorus capsularis TaxID=210143 RepID=A0A1R3HZA5_COCAP|nr:hypothetical protein CCACVL1_16109 [Corchorus capsularis]